MVVLPIWLRTLIRKVTESDSWPGGEYPTEAFAARAAIADVQGDDGQVSLLQLVIDEVGRLQQWVNDCQAGMYINCVYCGHRYGPDDEVSATMADVLKKHVEHCLLHPMSHLRIERDDLARALFQIRNLTMQGKGNKQVADIACDAVLGINETPLKDRVAAWLISTGVDWADPITLTIKEQSWEGAMYRQQGIQQYYLVGMHPEPKQGVYYQVAGNNNDWYLAAYLDNYDDIRDRSKRYHPFGNNWILKAWTLPCAIDEGEPKHPRIMMVVT